jgi:hypothetical protein
MRRKTKGSAWYYRAAEKKSNKAWDDLMGAADQISEKWTEISAVDKIRLRREKTW